MPLRTLDFLKSAARSNGQILNTDIYVTAIADGRARFYGEVRVRPIFGFSAYGSQFQTSISACADTLFEFEGLRLDLWVKVTGNGALYPLHHLTYAPAKFEVSLPNI